MNRIFVVLLAILALLQMPLQAEVLVGNKILPEVTVTKFMSGRDENILETITAADSVKIRITSKGRKLLETESLGTFPARFEANGKPVSAAVVDIDGDRIPEVAVSAFDENGSQFFYVYKFDAQKRIYQPMVFTDSINKMERDFAVSDIGQPAQDNIILIGKRVVLLGKNYTDEGPKPAQFVYELRGGTFKYIGFEGMKNLIKYQGSKPIEG
ncbi:MAG: hypothetical protein GX221_02915 [Candidatus Riflebacteria bacterium]|nr:hypothetical protein [Candidatus Riflebacteria bacterium]